jgi:hypothetical protein
MNMYIYICIYIRSYPPPLTPPYPVGVIRKLALADVVTSASIDLPPYKVISVSFIICMLTLLLMLLAGLHF